MTMAINLNGIKMNVVETDPAGVVNHETVFKFSQTGATVSAEYSGGKIEKGFLVGTITNNTLEFSYCQKETNGKLDFGISKCEISREADGKLY